MWIAGSSGRPQLLAESNSMDEAVALAAACQQQQNTRSAAAAAATATACPHRIVRDQP